MAPLFSIITVTYNAADNIAHTVRSVASQTCALYEHIIMDGKSADNTIDIARKEGNDHLVIFSEPDKGIYYAMNNALSRAKGDYVIFLNAGDTFHSVDTLQHMADAILNNDYPGIVYGQTRLVDSNRKDIGPRHLKAPEELTLKSLKNGMVVCHQSMAVLTRIAPFYNITYKYSADYEWVIMCLQHSKRNVYLPEPIADYLNEGTTTRHHKESLKERFKIMCTYYGTFPTVLRHIKFVIRYLLRRPGAPNAQ